MTYDERALVKARSGPRAGRGATASLLSGGTWLVVKPDGTAAA
jgi:hypothetical protein